MLALAITPADSRPCCTSGTTKKVTNSSLSLTDAGGLPFVYRKTAETWCSGGIRSQSQRNAEYTHAIAVSYGKGLTVPFAWGLGRQDSSRGGELPASGISLFSEDNFIAIAVSDGDCCHLSRSGLPQETSPWAHVGRVLKLHHPLGSEWGIIFFRLVWCEDLGAGLCRIQGSGVALIFCFLSVDMILPASSNLRSRCLGSYTHPSPYL